MQTIQDVLAHPSAIVTQPLHLEIATLQSPVSVFSFVLTEEMNAPFVADITVTSKDKHIDGAAVVGRPAIFTIEEHASVPSLSELINPVQRAARTVHGIVTQWTRIKTSRDEATYQVLLKPRLALLEQVHDSAVFLDRSFRELLSDTIIDRELFQSYDVEFELDGLDAKLDQTVMYEETVANFIDRHCRRAGVFYYFKHAKKEDGPQRDTLVFSNTARGYMREIEVPLLPNSGLVSWHEAILELNVTRSLVPQTVREWDHNYRQPDDPLQVESAVAEKADRSVYGSINRSIEHFHTAEEGQALADARRDGLITRQTRIAGKSNVMGMMPGMVVRVMNDVTPEAPHGFVITKLVTTGSRKESVTNQFEAIPSHLTYRPDYVPERHWRWVAGALIGIVESGDDQPYAWMDEYGGYRVRFLFTRHTGKRGANSMSLRLLRTSASYQGGLHVPLLPNTEVRVIATQGNCDRLLIAGATHDYARRDLVHGKEGWYSRAVFRSPLLGNKLRFEDLKDHEGIRLATVFGQSSLNMGYLVDSEKNKRGEGFELTTKKWGTVRAPKGLFVSADAAGGSEMPHLDMPAAVAQLKAALQRVTDLAAATTQVKADSADRATQAALLDSLNQLRDAGLLASAPAGMAFVTPKSTQHSAGENVIVTAGQDMDVSVVRRLRMVAGDLISLCAHKVGIKIFSKGKIELQAQRAAMDLFADDQLHVSSANANVLVNAKTSAMVASGGASMTVENGNVVFNCPGEFRIRAATFTFEGPGHTSVDLPQLPVSDYQPGARYSHTQ
ncbi:TPA: type VI secretion system tip protein VgrG [Burkholderia vietnamiensis]|uniref:type VI secretion system Vgr family protein n=1 Tax=Burkholderia vietnamiensis TaxID=60552 RepID=UPI0007574778|nr:type VI secretion system tip protein VgrG [Burkholderia vietnamiensis]KVF07654.1 type IV secretion protein Rhs [Burkholderia vietnamiensis]HDR9010772.1 type VI secretion system tip protein VgrG [Burkholderia vietnamiensis]HDR9014118.1 type VI secretion system tip protein VgrG [Burkholderia vietnamiensis]HDR9148465.1 type VI secretion system tip protein VgrG [Burkholderia vietnamiensis]